MSDPGADVRATGPRGRRWWGLAAGALLLAAGLSAYALAGPGSRATNSTPLSAAAPHPGSASAALAPNGTYVTPSGTTSTIASLRGRPTMVWFVAGGCASCAASIPAVASHLAQLTRAGLQVLTLGLYGDFSSGSTGVGQLLSFGRAAAGTDVERPGWQWGMASKSLSLAYDPSGTPDLYVLIGPTGHIRYRNSVPVATMGKLLAVADRLVAHGQTTAVVLPCC